MAEQRLVVVGSNDSGECCLPGAAANIAAPTAAPLESLPDGKLVEQTAEGSGFTLLLDRDGELWSADTNHDDPDNASCAA